MKPNFIFITWTYLYLYRWFPSILCGSSLILFVNWVWWDLNTDGRCPVEVYSKSASNIQKQSEKIIKITLFKTGTWCCLYCEFTYILTGTPTGKRPLGWPRRMRDNIRIDLKQIGINMRNWVDSTLDRYSGEPLWMWHWTSGFHKPWI